MTKKTATLYRMALPAHMCPYGLKAKHVLRAHGYKVEDTLLRTREEVDQFKSEHGVDVTPQVYVDGERIGGYEDVRRFVGKPLRDPEALTYTPVIALFATAILVAIAIQLQSGTVSLIALASSFGSMVMVLLALQKLRNVESFSTMFLNYDLLAKRWVPYSYLYPYAELGAGILMLAGIGHLISIPLALFIGSIGAVSVVYAVYVQKRELKCACVGGDTNVPLGPVSLFENLLMISMAVGMTISMII